MLVIADRTIAAISTPPGEGGIAVIRISGSDALRVTDTVFAPNHKNAQFEHAKAVFGTIIKDGGAVDRGFAVYFKAPESYTGEDIVEISCHGGRFVTQKALELIFAAGASPAEPGEFTKRAFLNNKIDLVQAEAVAALIHADTEKSHALAQQQLSGKLSSEYSALKNDLQEMLTLLEANIDFSEDGIETVSRKDLEKRLTAVGSRIHAMIDSYAQGRLLSSGIRVAIVGPSNAGKSSLMNALCEKERVIVDEHPGTTRDLVEETISVDGQKITLIDTAGIRKSRNRVESKGIELARKAALEADISIVVFDANAGIPAREARAFDTLPCRSKIHILNKSDLNPRASFPQKWKGIRASAKTLAGVDRIKKAILNKANFAKGDGENALITSERQKECLKRALEPVLAALKLLKDRGGEELLAVELRAALKAIASITGEITDDDILNNIFGKFCIGK